MKKYFILILFSIFAHSLHAQTDGLEIECYYTWLPKDGQERETGFYGWGTERVLVYAIFRNTGDSPIVLAKKMIGPGVAVSATPQRLTKVMVAFGIDRELNIDDSWNIPSFPTLEPVELKKGEATQVVIPIRFFVDKLTDKKLVQFTYFVDTPIAERFKIWGGKRTVVGVELINGHRAPKPKAPVSPPGDANLSKKSGNQ